MIRIAVVEDEDAAAGELLRFLDEYGRSRGEALKTARYADGDDLVSHYGEGFDIILMDIELPLLDGMTAAELIRDRDQEVIIIFITNAAQRYGGTAKVYLHDGWFELRVLLPQPYAS